MPTRRSRNESIKVFVRIRPLVQREDGTEAVACVGESVKEVLLDSAEHSASAQFDHVFGPGSTQGDIYDQCSYVASSVLEGFNATMFAYGQTGSGKTYTMFGDPHQASFTDEADKRCNGIIPRSIEYLFERVQGLKDESDESGQRFSISCSFLQVYNEKLYDLLLDEKVSSLPNILSSRVATMVFHRQQNLQPLQIREDINSGLTYVEGLS